jgi:osmotically-inducible protein OsmY
MKLTGTRAALVTAFAAFGLAACQNTAEGVRKDAKDAAEQAKQAAEHAKEAGAAAAESAREAGQAAADAAASAAKDAQLAGKVVARDAKDAAKKAAEAASHASEKAAEASKEAGAVVAAATNTLDVKAALMADRTIDASHINVDTDAKTRTVVLKGSVPTEEQRTAAEKLAASKAAGYKVVNDLAVVKK